MEGGGGDLHIFSVSSSCRIALCHSLGVVAGSFLGNWILMSSQPRSLVGEHCGPSTPASCGVNGRVSLERVVWRRELGSHCGK